MAIERLYKRAESPYWYYNAYNPLTKKRIRKSTHETDYDKALKVYLRATSLEESFYATPLSSLATLIKAYTVPKYNPRYIQAQVDGTSYGLQHAQRVANQATYLLKLLQRDAPGIVNKCINDITKIDIKVIKATLVNDKGRCRMTQNVFQNLKTFLSQASEDGLIESSPARDVKNIIYEEKKRCAIENTLLAKVIAARHFFVRDEDWAYFTILATTGMRRSEALALNIEQLNGGFLNIDRALKSESQTDIGLPKCNVTRIIPLSKITQEAIASLKPDKKGRLFPHGRYWVDGVFHRVQAVASSLYPEYNEVWQSMTPHVLRHSLNTNLLCSGSSPLLVAEYLSWAHQELVDMQIRYTHIYASSMSVIADKIDELYTEKELQAKACSPLQIQL